MDIETTHNLILGDCTQSEMNLHELPAIDLLITSPPYFNAPFDYKELFLNYESFLDLIDQFTRIFHYKMKPGAIVAINIDDMLIKGIKYPIISDTIKIFRKVGYKLKGRIIWRKPEGYIRISRRSGVLLQNPYPMYFYPDNLLENILIFQKLPSKKSEKYKKLILEDIWEIVNVLPLKGRLETNIAAFPDELPKRLIQTFSTKGSLICDPFLGSGTTMKVARELRRNSIGIEKIKELEYIIRRKAGFSRVNLWNYFDNDELITDVISFDENYTESQINKQGKNHSLLNLAIDPDFDETTDYKFHLIILDCRKTNKTYLNERLSENLKLLHPGRILIVYYDSLDKHNKNFALDQLFDFIMSHGIRLRDKITVQHEAEHQWEIKTNFQNNVIFNHNYYEVFIFQRGKFDYKSKTREEKQACLIDKQQFQKEKWFLSLWDFRTNKRDECDQIVTDRMTELFLYSNETLGSNLTEISCSKRHFIFQNLEIM